MIGRTLSNYRILEQIGAGGMGVVYRARDERLDREVAIKVLPEGTLADEAARRRSRAEARALSRLNHPNVETLYHFDSHDGIDFLVLELVAGETLDDRIRRGPLTEDEILDLGVQLTDGLAAAHGANVLHRDLKPENLRITREGRLKIVDFGLARGLGHDTLLSTSRAITDPEHIAGTPPYLAPEQVSGGPLDERSDVHAVGAVLYEMACGSRAFPQPTVPALVYAVLHEMPAAPRERGARISAELERIILRCLAKDPEQRFPSAHDLAVDLRRLTGRPTEDVPARRRPTRPIALPAARVWAPALVIAIAATLFALDLGGVRGHLLGGGAAGATRSLAVLPFANLSGDPSQDYFSDGMTDELITRLAQVGALRVTSRSSVMRYRGTRKPLRDVARELGADFVVEGSVARDQKTVRIAAHLVDAARDQQLWAESYQRDARNVLAMQSEVARSIVDKIQVRLTPAERGRLGSAAPVDPAAHEAYLRGLAYFNSYSTEGFRNAIEQFRAASRIDPGYAPAYVGLATTYEYMSGMYMSSEEAMGRARAACAQALDLDPQLASAHAAQGYVRMIYDWDWAGAEESFRRALELNPSDVTAHQNYGVLLTALGRWDESLQQFDRARAIDPLSSLVASMSLWPLFEGRRWDACITAAQRVIEADPTSFSPRMVLGQALLFDGQSERALVELRKAAELDPQNPFPLGWLGFGYGYAGDRSGAERVRRQLEKMAETSYVQPYTLALVHGGLGERDQAIAWLEKALAVKSDELGFLNVDPGMDSLRSDPRFQAILARLKFPHRA